MRAYETIKFTECPDVGDIGAEGRRSRIGRIPRGESYQGKVKHNDRGYNKPKVKAATRRNLKRVDRQRVSRMLEGINEPDC